jgi:hypothetical protein
MNTSKLTVVDAGKVRLGGMAPALMTTIDAGKVRLGGMAPALATR